MLDLKKLKKDNKGAAMVMVLVIILYIAIIAAVLMFVSYLGLQMRFIDKRGKDTFYTAETVLDEINAGLQQEASQAMAKAYNEVMTNYAVYDSTIMRSSEFYRKYINTLEESLTNGGTDGTYDMNKIRSWLSADVVGNGDGSYDPADITDVRRANRNNFGSWGAIVESETADGTIIADHGMLDKKESESLLLKDLKVTYVDQSGYVSIISTNIKLILPTVSFAQSSELPKLEKFSLIADETLAAGNRNVGGSVTIKGNAYAGRMTVGKTDVNNFQNDSNVTFASATGAGEENMSLVISREDVVVNDGMVKTDNVEFWGRNVLLSSADMDFNGITNLKDDLILEGNASKAKLTGEYNGFSMLGASSTGTGSGAGSSGSSGAGGSDEEEDSNEPALSSAIIINGRDSSLDLSGLESMTIAGRSYVQTKTDTTSAEGSAVPETYRNKKDIVMAESVAVKSNQLIYLVPPEAVGCVIEADGTIGDTAYGANPLTYEQYMNIVDNPDDYLLINGKRQIAALGYKPLSNYISLEQVAGQVEKAYMPEVVFKQTNKGTLVYLYLRFTDEQKANQYFQDYYNVNYDQVDRFMKLYADEIRMPDPEAMLYLNLSGNMLAYNGETDPVSFIPPPDNGISNYYIKKKQAETIYNSKTSAFKALSAKLVTNIAQLTTVEQGRNAFENIINTTKLTDMLAASGVNTLRIETGTAGSVNTAILTREANFVVNSSTPAASLIVSTGNVEVESSFNGLIIAAGNIVVRSEGPAVEITPLGIEDFSKLLSAETDIGGATYYVMDVFNDGMSYQTGMPDSSGTATESVALKDLIVYEQWIKR